MVSTHQKSDAGLSPRVRGNPYAVAFGYAYAGSIPACTGEPVSISSAEYQRRVYPRVYGGTAPTRATSNANYGLSPRVRGNRGRASAPIAGMRSIPACTGEPSQGPYSWASTWVYPRVYGGTSILPMPLTAGRGLSPRVRGNHACVLPACVPWGSIPACTGEPHCFHIILSRTEVYPRVYGGTRIIRGYDSWEYGLSPRVRGNPLCQHSYALCAWSIPACTGEPYVSAPSSVVGRVYPRVYGGTGRGATA